METTLKFQVKEIQWPGKTFVIKRAKMSFDKLTPFFSAAYSEMYQALGKAGIKPTDAPFAIYYAIDEKKMETDLAAAVPVLDGKFDIPGFPKVTIPKSKALFLTYFGGYDNMGPAYAFLDKYLTDHKLTKTWMLEEYLTDPKVEKDPAKWKTNIYFMVK